MTSGGKSGTSGGRSEWRRPQLLTALCFAGVGLVYMVVNAASAIDERRALGLPVDPWRPWAWEATSLLGWLLLLPLMIWAAARLAPPRAGVTTAVAAHLLLSIPVSLAHTALVWTIRKGTFWLVEEEYRFSGPLLDILVYEYRKDLVTYAAVVAGFLLFRRLLGEPQRTPAATEDHLVEVRDGSSWSWIRPDEIDVAAAAGNYVELRGAFGVRLARRTLADVQSELQPWGFVRVHRSHLVRKAAVRTITVKQSGDFELVLSSGEHIPGSRRYRHNIDR